MITAFSLQTGQQARFDFNGSVVPADSEIPVNRGLHHHGEEPEVSCCTYVHSYPENLHVHAAREDFEVGN